MLKRITYTLFLIGLGVSALAQQDPQFNQYMFNPMGINPAYAGSRGMLSVAAIHRSQWVGFEGAPTSQAFAIHAPLHNRKMGIGFQLLNDRIGPKNTVAISGVYAYRLKLSRGKLAFGLRASLYNYRFDWDQIEYKDNIGVSDQRGKETLMAPSFDFGMYYNTKKMYAGLEFAHLNEARLGIQTDNVNLQSTVRQRAHMVATVGRAFKINRWVVLKPSVLLKTASNAPAFIDVNGSVLLRDKLWLGLSYRHGYGAVAIFEYNVSKNLRIGYSYDITIGTLRQQNSSSHEIFLGYDLNIYKTRLISPRYF